jgi:hypothetical protein
MNKSFTAEEYKDLLQDEIRIFLNNPQHKIMEEVLDGIWDEVLLDLLMGEVKGHNRIIILEEISKRFNHLSVERSTEPEGNIPARV